MEYNYLFLVMMNYNDSIQQFLFFFCLMDNLELILLLRNCDRIVMYCYHQNQC